MRITVSPKPSDASSDVVVVPVHADRKVPAYAAAAVPDLDLAAVLRAVPSFRGGVDDEPVVVPPTTAKQPTVVLAGVGPRASAGAGEVRTAALRASAAVRGRRRVATLLAHVGPDRAESARAAVEGALLGAYQRPRPGAADRPSHDSVPGALVVLLDPDDARDVDVRDAVLRGQVTGERAEWVRTLTDTPPGHLTPTVLADGIVRDAEEAGYTATVWSAKQVRERGFGGLLAVAKGSAEEPRVVELCHGDQDAPLGLVGKGITFDSGGINIKKSLTEISWMKADMASAAAVAGAVSAAARLGLDVGVCAILPLTENMPSGSATRPGDVISHPNGLTTKVTDTDCEGRLVLADGVAYLAARGVSGVIDIGTLTDAAGYGPSLVAAASTDDDLVAEVLAAGEAGGAPGWRMPVVESYVELLRSPVADLINGPLAIPDSSVLAATYLRQFAGATPWVHLDIGSTAWREAAWGGFGEGPTGTPVRTLVRLLEARAAATD